MKAKVSKKVAPKITPKIDPDLLANTVSNLLDALAGGKFILITAKEGGIHLDRNNVHSKVEFLGLLELAKG